MEFDFDLENLSIMEFDFDLENPLLLQPSSSSSSASSSSGCSLLFRTETDHMPSPTYVHSLLTLRTDSPLPKRRRQILSSILDLSRCINSKGDHLASYLAVNYMDRFLSVHPFNTDEEKPWMWKLVGASCFSLALKMRNIDFSLAHLLREDGDGDGDGDGGGMVVDPVTVERMEMLILGALKWRMRSLNPFSFFTFFLSFFDFKDQKTIQELKDMTTRILFKAQHDMKLLEFKPSIVAASALLLAAHHLLPPLLFPSSSWNSISNSEYVNKENLLKCYNVMQQLSTMDGCDSFSQASLSLWTPHELLDIECFSSLKTSGTKRRRETSVCRNKKIRLTKQLKFDDFCNE